MILGYVLLGFQFSLALYAGLSLVLCGIGLFKGNISSLIGMLYSSNDNKKSDGYNTFFMFIMLGAILGPFIFGLMAKYIGWQYCFWLCALGNLSGLIFFILQRKKIHYQQLPTIISILPISIFWLGLFATIITISLLFAYPILSNHFLGLASLLSVLFLLLLTLASSHQDANKVIGLTLLSLLLVFYYAASFQVNGSMIIGIEKNFSLTILNWKIPATTFASLEALFAFLLSPIATRCWHYLTQQFFAITWLFKLSCGLLFACLSFVIFAWLFSHPQHPFIFLLLANLLLGMSVVCIFPTHMAIVSEYAPLHAQGTLMGMSFLSDALAGYVGSHMMNAQDSMLVYAHCYNNIALLMLITLIILLISIPLFKWLLANNIAMNTA